MVLALLTIAFAVADQEPEKLFKDFIRDYGKNYSTIEEYKHRFLIFAKSLNHTKELNAMQRAAGGEDAFGITEFSDMSPEEFRRIYLTLRRPDNFTARPKEFINASLFAESVDWRGKALTGVRSQGRCGCCYAFAGTQAIESYLHIAQKKSLSHLSVQQVVDCDRGSIDNGCGGGDPGYVMAYVAKTGGIESDSSYPYISANGGVGMCKFSRERVTAKIGGGLKNQGENFLAQELKKGPPAVVVAADSLQYYQRGAVVRSCPGQINHAVQAVGYSAGGNYWIVRNSWGEGWGDRGFFYVSAMQNVCQIGHEISFPKL